MLDRVSVLAPVSADHEGGSVPENEFPARLRKAKDGIIEMLAGRIPVPFRGVCVRR